MYTKKSKGFTRKNFSKKNLGGFTLIELLVVIAIIGVLAGVILSSLNSARAKGRDAKRDSDIHQIKNALALYYDDHQQYPDATGPTTSNDATEWGALSTALTPYIKTLPVDPLNNSSYYYTYETTDILSTDYVLTAIYERDIPNTITILNPVANLGSTFGASPRTIAITTPTVGNMLVVAVWDTGNYGSNSVTDNQGNTYTQILSFTDSNGTPIQFYRTNNLTGTMPTSLSVSWVAGANRGIGAQMVEMSGVDGANPVDFTGSHGDWGAGISQNFSTANANEAVFAFVFVGNGGRDYTVTQTGYTRSPAAITYHTLLHNSNVGTAGSKALSLTWISSTSCSIALVTFNPAP